jgi:hypothetical protein
LWNYESEKMYGCKKMARHHCCQQILHHLIPPLCCMTNHPNHFNHL